MGPAAPATALEPQKSGIERFFSHIW
jgi:hypothetical protein